MDIDPAETTVEEKSLRIVEQCIKNAPDTTPRPAKLPYRKPNAAPYLLHQLAKSYTEEALETIVGIMQNPDGDASTRLEAAKVLLDRGWGKPTVQIKQETIKYTISDLTKALEQSRSAVQGQIEEARRLENDGLAKYITCDVEVLGEPSTDSGTTL